MIHSYPHKAALAAFLFVLAFTFGAPVLAQTYGPPTIVAGAYRYAHISTTTTTTAKSSPGLLHAICVNAPTATAVITVYDNTGASGTVIAAITEASTTQGCFYFDAVYSTGLTIATTVTASDVTVLFQ